MTRALLVLRPEPGTAATVAAAEVLGLAAIAAPLFIVTPLDWAMPARLPQAVMMTSANAARHGGAALAQLAILPLYAVGEATAAAARAAGFTRIVTGDDGVDAIVARARADGVEDLLHLAGREHRPPADAGIAIERRIVYAADAVRTLPEAARAALPGAVALLHSPRAAALFASLVDPQEIMIAAISPATRDAAGPGWLAATIAEQPSDASLLAAAAKLCDQRRRDTGKGGMESEFDLQERRPRTWLWILLLALCAFVGGALAMGWLVTHDAHTAHLLHLETAAQAKTDVALAQKVVVKPVPMPVAVPAGAADPQIAKRVETLEGKVADIETQAKEATGDASRAEGLLVAFAARRALDRGAGLGYIEGLLRERFGGTQPQAVATILSASRQPVTLADLQNGLDAMAPALAAGGTPNESWWQSVRNAFTGMIVVRRAGEPSTLPVDRVTRAQRLLEAGQVDGALAEIVRLTDHRPADKWIVAARRYLVGRAALDQIETAALLDPTTPVAPQLPSPSPSSANAPSPARPVTQASD